MRVLRWVCNLSGKCLKILREYYRQYRPKEYLFEGAKEGKYSATSLRKIFDRALISSGIQKKATLHTLRHSFMKYIRVFPPSGQRSLFKIFPENFVQRIC